MSRLLYIQASPLGEHSFSIRAADAFLDAYRQAHPADEIDRLNLFEADLPPFDAPFARAKMAKMLGEALGREESAAWDRVERLIDRFKRADKYLLAVPMWNFGIPFALKLYIDHLVQPGYTFDPSAAKGSTGLVGDKPTFVAYARGGEYKLGPEGDPFDFQKSYLEAVFGLIGIRDNLQSVVVQPTLAQGPDAAKQNLAEIQKKVREIAGRF